jgi:hypothetical protein
MIKVGSEYFIKFEEEVSKVRAAFIFCSPTTEAVGSNFYNIFGTNGFSRWSTN